MPTEYVYFESPLGTIRISETASCISEVSFIQADTSAQPDLQEPHNVSEVLKKCVQKLTNYFNGDISSFDLPLELDGTPFQKRVWSCLCHIPYGKRLSYAELSKQLGDPKAIRAVGTANSKNKIAIIVPCHRVIGSNGSLVGYAGELWRKKWLLEHEGKHAHGVQKLF
ncbi:MAG: methylated-DNA--[protein]-cysteine S-methyltransferase [Ferruginibacter sp.]